MCFCRGSTPHVSNKCLDTSVICVCACAVECEGDEMREEWKGKRKEWKRKER